MRKRLKVGDLVASPDRGWAGGIVVEMIDDIEVPPVAVVLWEGGELAKEWTDELELISEAG